MMQLTGMDERPDFNFRVHAIAHTKLLRLAHACRQKLLVQTAMYVTSLDRKASLPGVDECSPNRAARCDVHVRIVEHNHGIFATKLEHNRKQAGSRRLGDFFSCRHTASKN